MRHLIPSSFLRITAILLALATLFATFDSFYWLLELYAHFVVQYMVLALLLLPLVLHRRLWRSGIILMLVLGIHSAEIHQIATEFSHAPVTCRAPYVRILQSNVYYRNGQITEAARELEKLAEQADIVVLNEFDHEWRAREEGRFKRLFPHAFVTWIDGNIEKIGIFSREAFFVQQRAGTVDDNAHLRLIFPALGLTLFTYHGFTPINPLWVQERDREILRIAEEMKRLHSPGVLTGDFNQTPYATSFQNALRAGNLKLGPFPKGLRPTWPDMWFMAPFTIPIDHMLVNAHARICDREVIRIPGSDHSATLDTIALYPDAPNFSELQKQQERNNRYNKRNDTRG